MGVFKNFLPIDSNCGGCGEKSVLRISLGFAKCALQPDMSSSVWPISIKLVGRFLGLLQIQIHNFVLLLSKLPDEVDSIRFVFNQIY